MESSSAPTTSPNPERPSATDDSRPAAAALDAVSPSPVASTPVSPSPPPEAAIARTSSVSSRVSRISKLSQGTRRSRFYEALPHDDDIEQNYEVGAARGRASMAFSDAGSLQQRRRSRSSSLGLRIDSSVGGVAAATDREADTAAASSATSVAPQSSVSNPGRRTVAFSFPAPPNPGTGSSPGSTPSLGTGTPTTPGFGYNDRTQMPYGGANPFGDAYATDTPTSYTGAGATVDFDAQSRTNKSANQSTMSINTMGTDQPYDYPNETERLKGKAGSDSPNVAYFFDRAPHHGFIPTMDCPARRHFFRTRWVTSSVILLSIYATAASGLFLAIALRGPEWPMIRTNGSLTPSNASLLTAVVAKTIELSFGSAIVAFIGQVLSRRSLSVRGSGRGITLAEMSMRNWISSPGSMVSNFETVRYGLLTILGIVSFVSAIVATLYTSASDALVQPQLKLGALEHKIMKANVITEWANHAYLGYKCETPITISEDEVYRNASCLDISYASQSLHDYQRFLAEWQYRAQNHTAGTSKQTRVPAYSLFRSEISVNGTWLDVTAGEWNGRVINNVSLAMPHAGVLRASQDKRNEILQPEELGGLGAYSLVASVPSPVIHVLCANLNREELSPIVYTAWPNASALNASTWPDQISFVNESSLVNKTVVDDLFGWGKDGQLAPIFPRYPIAYNTVLNQTFAYGRESIYLLGRDSDTTEERYAVCQLKASLTPNCSTTYAAAHEGSSLSSYCDPENDDMAYIWSDPGAASGSSTVSKNWPWIGVEWGNSMSLNAGITDGKASIARILTQFMLREPKLDTDRPSIAETLAVLAGSTLLMGTQDAQFEMDWNHDKNLLLTPETQNFNATLRGRTYASGPTGEPQKGFFIVLMLAFLINILCLAYFIFHRGLVTDFSEPPNLFSLAVNSPPAAAMAGSCGGGPAGPQWNCQWYIGESGGHLFVVPKEAVPAVIAARGNMGDAWRVEEAASWPQQHPDQANQYHQHYYGQVPQYASSGTNIAQAPPPQPAQPAQTTTSTAVPAAGLFSRLKNRLSQQGGEAPQGAPPGYYYRVGSGNGNTSPLGTPLTPMTPVERAGAPGTSAGPIPDDLKGVGATSSPASTTGSGGGGLYQTTTRGTAFTRDSSFDVPGPLRPITAGSAGRSYTMAPPGVVRQQQGTGTISRAYSKLSRKRTFL